MTLAGPNSHLAPRCWSCMSARSRLELIPARKHFSSFAPRLSGHSKWATIKHDKAKVDAARSKTRTMHSIDITLASKMYGADPKMNTRLADAIARAKKASMPKANIETAIARGQGLSPSGSRLDSFLEEGTFPQAGVAILVDVLTDNKQQAKIDIRRVFKMNDVQQSSSAYLFEKRGQLDFASKDGVNEESLLEEAVNVDALDVETSDSGYTVYTELKDMTRVADHLRSKLGLEMQASEITWFAKETVDITEGGATVLAELIEKLRDIPSVKEIYTNAK